MGCRDQVNRPLRRDLRFPIVSPPAATGKADDVGGGGLGPVVTRSRHSSDLVVRPLIRA